MKLRILLFLSLMIFFVGGNASAVSFSSLNAGTNITIGDSIPNSTCYTGSPAIGVGGEDNETETGTYTGQMWDLEGMFVNQGNNSITIIGGTNFRGFSFGGVGFSIGDLFLGHLGSTGFDPSYAFQFSRGPSANLEASGAGSIFGSGVIGSAVTHVSMSNPFRYAGGGTLQGSFNYTTGTVEGSPFAGWTWLDPATGLYDPTRTDNRHYFLQLSGLQGLDQLIATGNDIFHITLSCGNDDLTGKATVPEPSAFLLFASGLVGLIGWSRRRKQTL